MDLVDERRIIRRAFLRLMPLLMFGSAMSYLDRVNIGFAALTMNRDLGLSPAAYGIASSAFFLAYAACEIPSNLIMAKIGARRWLARIMITWGIVSALTACVVGFKSLIAMRIVLGIAEAGFTPGVFWLFTWWFPRRYQARAIAAFLFTQVIGVVFGSAISGPLLQITWLGVHGWQWMFVLQGIPTLLGGAALLFTLAETPQQARWLTTNDREWLQKEIDTERAALNAATPPRGSFMALAQPRFMLLSGAYLLMATSSFGITFFIPQILRDTGLSLNMTGLASAVIWSCSGIGLLLWGWWTDHTSHPERVIAVACGVFALGFAGLLTGHSIWLVLPMLCAAATGSRAAISSCLSLPPAFMHANTLALAIAFIQVVGNVGGIFGPTLFGTLRETTHGYDAGMAFSAALGLVAASMILLSVRTASARAQRGF